MRGHRNLALATSMIAGMAAVAAPREIDDTAERKTPLPPAPKVLPEANRPGETNRQFAARMRAEAADA